MSDYLNIGPGPWEEDCVQVNKDGDYTAAMRAECKRYIALIRKHLGMEPDGARLTVKGFPHDFGTYYEVVCVYNEDNEEAVEYALRCESDAPATWDLDLPLVCSLLGVTPIESFDPDHRVTAIVESLTNEQIAALNKCRFFAGLFPNDKGIRVEFTD
jgi:hypothetical protein